MKVIGQTEEGYLLSASADEIANLCGFYSHYSDSFPKLKSGDAIDVAGMYQQLRAIAAAGSGDGELASVATKLRKIAKALEERNPIIVGVAAGIAEANR